MQIKFIFLYLNMLSIMEMSDINNSNILPNIDLYKFTHTSKHLKLKIKR